MQGQAKITLEEFKRDFLRGSRYWPVGVTVELKNGNRYLVGVVNQRLESVTGKLDEQDIAYVLFNA